MLLQTWKVASGCEENIFLLPCKTSKVCKGYIEDHMHGNTKDERLREAIPASTNVW